MLIYRYLSYVLCYVLCGKLGLAEITEDLIPVLYLKYKEAFNDGESRITVRRFATNNKQYEIHVKKLKEVNGFKRHNLLVKETLRSNGNPLIYINNPIESQFPNTYLSIEEFKNAVTNRIKKQKDELAVERKRILNNYNITRIAKTKSKIPFKKTTQSHLNKINNKVEKSKTLSTKGTVKQSINKPTNNLLKKEIQPKLSTKHNGSKQSTVATKMHNKTVEITSTQTLINKSLVETTNTLIENKGTFLKTRDFSKEYDEEERTDNATKKLDTSLEKTTKSNTVKENKVTFFKTRDFSKEYDEEKRTEYASKVLSNQTVKVENISMETEVNSTTISPFISHNVTKAIDVVTEANSKEVNANKTEAVSINITNHITDSLPNLVNYTSENNLLTSTTEVTTLTIEKKKEKPKRSTVSEKPKGNYKSSTKTTKWKRSTLGRPMVFME